jgi:glutathione S-transferase
MIKIYGGKAPIPEIKGIIRELRPIWLLEEMGLPYERISLDPKNGDNRTEEYFKLHPFGKIPLLQDGDFTIFESAAICHYLAQKHEKFIPPNGTPEYYSCIQWCYFSVTNVEPQTSRLFACDIMLEKGPTTNAIREMAVSNLKYYFEKLEKIFETRMTLLASGFSIADILLTSCIGASKDNMIYESFPLIRKYFQTHSARPAYIRAFDKNGT